MFDRAPGQLPSLSMMLDDLGHNPDYSDVARYLGVESQAMRSYVDQEQAPKSCMLALFWQTRWGMSILDAEITNAARVYKSAYDTLAAKQKPANDGGFYRVESLQKWYGTASNAPAMWRFY